MKERPILFSAPMVRAILAGTKTVTRRIVNLRQFGESDTKGYDWTFRCRRGMWHDFTNAHFLASKYNRYGAAGERLWVREAFTHITGNGIRIHYRADGEPVGRDGNVIQTEAGLRRWAPSIHMPRKWSRITLEVVSVRVERLHDITEDDARAEGVDNIVAKVPTCLDAFRYLWDDINGERAPWSSNPWIWRVEFKRVEQEARAA